MQAPVETTVEAAPETPRPLRKTRTSSSTASNPKSPSSANRRESIGQLVRTASARIIDANPPSGAWSAAGQLASRAPSMSELRGSAYASPKRQSSQPIQSPAIPEQEAAPENAMQEPGNRQSQSSMGGTPFMTPLQTPIAIANNGWLDEPEEMDEAAPERAKEPPLASAKSDHGSSSSDDTIQGEIGNDADLRPAISMMTQEETVEQTPTPSRPESQRESKASKHRSATASESSRRTSVLGRLLKGKANVKSEELDDELSPEPKRRSKNLDKFFGEDTRKAGGSSAMGTPGDPDDQPKRHSKNLDKFFGEDTSKSGAHPAAGAQPKRHTRDFADLVEGDDGDFPDILFGRDSMPTQSYDPSHTTTTTVKPESRPISTATAAAAKARLARDIQSEPPKLSPPAVDPALDAQIEKAATGKPTAGASSSAPAEGEEGEEEDIDWDDFMREFDERPPRRSKRASKDVSKFFGEDPNSKGRATPVAALETEDKPEQQQPATLSPVEDDAAAEKNAAAAAGSRRAVNLRIKPTGLPPTIAHATSDSDPINAPAEKARSGTPDEDIVYPTGYRFPPKKTAWQGFVSGMKAFALFSITPFGFLIVLYGCLVVAWGGMLFLLLCNASAAMCTLGDGRYDCNDINSPRRVWIEYDSQILNALFCVTGFGLIPWRFRDFYYLLRFRIRHEESALRRLAGYHNGWFRLPESAGLPVPSPLPSSRIDPSATEGDPAYPLPLKRAPLLPLTGERGPATALWKMDFVVWAFVINTALQACLSGFMWGLNRYDRPSWSTGLFVAMACVVAAFGGIMQFVEGRRLKRVEGIPWEDVRQPDHEVAVDFAAVAGFAEKRNL